MLAKLQHIEGKAPEALSGSLSINLDELEQSNGALLVDLQKLEISQRTRTNPSEAYSEPVVRFLQNQHMRARFDISKFNTEEERSRNRYAEFRIVSVQAQGPTKGPLSMKGRERTMRVVVSGILALHGHESRHSFGADATFTFDGPQCTALSVKNLEPLRVSLAQHSIRPRTGLGIVSTMALGKEKDHVATHALVSFVVHASLGTQPR
jgi:hypothetical protein